MRILHLLDPAVCGDEGLLACASCLCGPPLRGGTLHEVWLIGNTADERRAWSLGFPCTDRIQPRARGDAGRALTRLLRVRSPQPDIVQCWSLPALALARECFGADDDSPARVAVICRPPMGSAIDSATGRGETICALDPRTRRAIAPLIGAPDDALRWGPAIRLLEPPAFSPGGPIALDRADVRARLGLEPADVVLVLLADPPGAADAQAMMFAAGVLHALGHRVVCLIRRGARQERRAAAYLRAHAHRWGLILADLSLPELIAAGDVGVVDRVHLAAEADSPTCGPLAVGLALSMGLPIAAAPDLFLADPSAAGEAWPVRQALSRSPGRVAVPLADILESRALRVDLAAAGGGWCERALGRDGFRSALTGVWAEAAGVADPVVLGG